MTDPLFATESYDPDRLFAGDKQVITRDVNVPTGQTLVRGSVLGVITASGNYILSLNAAVDGSEVARAICLKDVTTTADTLVPVVIEGEVNEDRLTFGTGQTADNTREDLQSVNIILRKPETADPAL